MSEPKWCVKTADLEKCRNAARDAGLNVTCYGSDGSCVNDVIDGKARMALASANDMVANGKLVILGANICFLYREHCV